jgi:aminomethyltransferase
LFAVQGPAATDIIAEVAGAAPARFRLSAGSFGGEALAIAGTGYTGERGGEIAVPLAVAGDLFRAFVAAGAVPCGLGARDTLRLEMGYPLWGQDLDEATTPLEAGLGWVVDWDHDFVGKEALARQRDGGLSKRLVGFVLDGRRIPRHGYPLRAGDSAGAVASGNFSPTLECGIGMGYLAPDPGPDPHGLEVDIRGDWLPARATEPPFIRSD